MKRIALYMLILSGAALYGTYRDGTSREQFADAIAHSDVPKVDYLLRQLSGESIGSYQKGVLLENLTHAAQTVYVRAKKQDSFLRHPMPRVAQAMCGILCALVGGYVAMYGYKQDRISGLKNIYDRWSASRSQRMKDYYFLVGGGVPALFGMYIVYKGVRSSSDNVSEARKVRDILEDYTRNLSA